MKKYIPILLSLTLVGCTTGSKTKVNLNYYSNTSCYGYIPPQEVIPQYIEPEVVYKEVPVVKYRTIYKVVPPRQASMTELGEEIGRKMLRKMRAAYNET
jgi:hypothetical protein